MCFATVTDRDGKLVPSLTRDDFEVRDEGKPQPITQFDNSPQPIRLIVMLDVSGSMEGNLPLRGAAGEQLFSRLGLTTRRALGRSGTKSPSARRSRTTPANCCGAPRRDRARRSHTALARPRQGD